MSKKRTITWLRSLFHESVEHQIRMLKNVGVLVLASLAFFASACNSQTPNKNSMIKDNLKQSPMLPEYTSHLSDQEYDVLVNKATDRPGDGGYTNTEDEGTYHCRACGAALYTSTSKFHSGCGWPSFDREIEGAVKRYSDVSYGMRRTEIVCSNCGGHLGHVFEGEHFTETNTRHCVNTSSLVFHPVNTQTIYLAAGDFHTAQYEVQKIKGVLYTETGYAGKDAASKHMVVKAEFDPSLLSYSALIESLGNIPTISGILYSGPEQLQLIAAQMKSESFKLEELSHYEKAGSEHQQTLLKARNPRR
jgi:peptide methionine sulfoxide reductase msrA/msrB